MKPHPFLALRLHQGGSLTDYAGKHGAIFDGLRRTRAGIPWAGLAVIAVVAVAVVMLAGRMA